MSQQSRLVAYLPSFRILVRRLRPAPTAPQSLSALLAGVKAEASFTPTLEIATPLSNPLFDRRFPLPGNVAVAKLSDVCENETVIFSHANPEPARPEIESVISSPSHVYVECCVQKSPRFLQSGFLELFPDAPMSEIRSGDLMVITLCQRTLNDMTAWTSAVQEERDELLENFIESAKCICGKLSVGGYWADFIDPSSGRAFLGGTYSPNTLFETDDRFRHFGFDVIDLGCCKCISHPLWGMHAFVGALFTNAPSDCPVLKELMLIKE
eukprot:m.8295 g.8295  ORF g.8295 m.8295 type:complete len:268 (+) comp20479_c0_seq1:218-1021(+)